MIVSHLLLILHKKIQFYFLCLKPKMWQKFAKFKGAEYFRKALYVVEGGAQAESLSHPMALWEEMCVVCVHGF